MADNASWITPAAAIAESFPDGFSELRPCAQVNLRGDIADLAFTDAVKSVTGLTLPDMPNKVATGKDFKALWLSPDEWLLVGEGDAEALVQSLEDALAGQHVAVNDVSANRTIFELSGPHSHHALMKSSEYDFHPRVFAPGDCVQTLIAKSQAIVEQVGENMFHIYVRSSFSRYVGGWLAEALAEYNEAP
ncbi:sarcosine oxidase subunit gamma [Sneathiella sp.]|uniref:sarcosine oxidase subunit gamma n=1 Tax=Sneathiella sp. TaxID=1964365 RepID=UPI00260FE1E6|nr:sarcosine oxidase subunit gamma family protein [Sneathiella sp.]MDF2368824.1 sarcosine oxidase subunit gamma family protein [Sneathiella sp.]